MEDLDDDRHLVIKESQLQNLKERLGQVGFPEWEYELGRRADFGDVG